MSYIMSWWHHITWYTMFGTLPNVIYHVMMTSYDMIYDVWDAPVVRKTQQINDLFHRGEGETTSYAPQMTSWWHHLGATWCWGGPPSHIIWVPDDIIMISSCGHMMLRRAPRISYMMSSWRQMTWYTMLGRSESHHVTPWRYHDDIAFGLYRLLFWPISTWKLIMRVLWIAYILLHYHCLKISKT